MHGAGAAQAQYIYQQATCLAQQGNGALLPNGTLCLHSLSQLESLCEAFTNSKLLNSTSVEEAAYVGAQTGACVRDDTVYHSPSAHDYSVDDENTWSIILYLLVQAVAHLIASGILMFFLWKWCIAPYVIVPLLQSDAWIPSVIRKYCLQPVYQIYFGYMPWDTIPVGVDDNDFVDGNTKAANINIGYQKDDDDDDDDDDIPPSPSRIVTNNNRATENEAYNSIHDLKKDVTLSQSNEDGLHLIGKTELDDKYLNNDERDHGDIIFKKKKKKEDEEEEEVEQEEEENDDIDYRPVFVITIDSIHPEVANTNEDMRTLLEQLQVQNVPPNSYTEQKWTKTATDMEHNEKNTDEASPKDDPYSSEKEEDVDIDARTFRTVTVPLCLRDPVTMGKDLPPPAYVGDSRFMSPEDSGHVMAAFTRPCLVTKQCVAANADDFWVNDMPSYTDVVNHLAAKRKPFPFPLEKRARLHYVPRNPVVEKRWYQEFYASVYPRLYYENMLRFHTQYMDFAETCAQFFTGGHIALLITHPSHVNQKGNVLNFSTDEEKNQPYVAFMKKHWHSTGPKKDRSRLYIRYTPSHEDVKSPERLGQNIADYLDRIVHTIIEQAYKEQIG
jgi:hypothetical protein